MITAVLASCILQAPITKTFIVEGVERSAIVYRGPKAGSGAPIVFVFHGFTGTGAGAARMYRVHDYWPEAVVVYPQGLTYHNLGRDGNGWQRAPGDAGNRDLKFVDAMLKTFKRDYSSEKAFACGMSNGALFTFLLFTERPKDFNAFASVAGAGGAFLRKASTPKPFMMVNGKADQLAPFRGAELSKNALIKINKCSTNSTTWSAGYDKYESKTGANVVFRAHEGGHTWPPGTSEAIVKFFKEAK